MSLVVHLVTDRGAGDPACSELKQRVAVAFPRAIVRTTFVAPRDTVAAAYRVAQLASISDGGDRLVAHDVAVGPGQPGPWPEGVDERLFVGRSIAGALVVGPNVGWTWSCVAADLLGLYVLDVPVPKRRDSRDRLGIAIVHARRRHPHAIAGKVPRAQVPALPRRIAGAAPRVAVQRLSPP
jgi:hypothetical protein